jgi:hypothetical protein
MANFHVVPRGDAIKHQTIGDRCPCAVEIRTVTSDDRTGFDVWHYHRVVTLDEAVMSSAEEQVA